MRPTGQLHLGNYHGALKNWVELQYQYECYFFVADWHALTTDYDDTVGHRSRTSCEMRHRLAGRRARSRRVHACSCSRACPEHAELHLLLSMITPLGWLERVPTLQGSAGAARGQGPRDLRLPRLSAAAERGHPALPPDLRAGAARTRSRTWRSRARSRGASTTSTAASLTSKTKAENGDQAARQSQQARMYKRVAHGIPGTRRPGSRSTRRAQLVETNTRLTRGRPRTTAAATWKASGVSILPEPRRC